MPPSWSTAIRSGSPRVQAACCSSVVTVVAVWRESQPFPSRRTPPIFPWRTRVRKAWVGGAVSVPTTTSAAGAIPAAVCARLVWPMLVCAVLVAPVPAQAATRVSAAPSVATAETPLDTRDTVAPTLAGTNVGFVDEERSRALAAAKERLDWLDLYPRPVSLRRVRYLATGYAGSPYEEEARQAVAATAHA